MIEKKTKNFSWYFCRWISDLQLRDPLPGTSPAAETPALAPRWRCSSPWCPNSLSVASKGKEGGPTVLETGGFGWCCSGMQTSRCSSRNAVLMHRVSPLCKCNYAHVGPSWFLIPFLANNWFASSLALHMSKNRLMNDRCYRQFNYGFKDVITLLAF